MRLGFWEIVVVLVVALVLFGPNRLPEMGKSLGKAIREFRQATSDLGNELSQAQQALEIDPPKTKPAQRRSEQQPAAEDPGQESHTGPEGQAGVEAAAQDSAEQRREPV
jgi:sec-independent protein translocase protein TatA